MASEKTSRGDRAAQALVIRLFRWHLRVYIAAMVVLVVINIAVGGGWWTFWPMCVWSILLAFHFLYYKTATVDEAWVEERTSDARLRSYDLGHIHDIEDRVEHRDASVRPADERDP